MDKIGISNAIRRTRARTNAHTRAVKTNGDSLHLTFRMASIRPLDADALHVGLERKLETVRQETWSFDDMLAASIVKEARPVRWFFAVDCTEHSQRAVAFALLLVNAARGDSASVLQVLSAAKHEKTGLSSELVARIRASERRCADVNVAAVARLLKAAGLADVVVSVEEGDAKTLICSEAQRVAATLIVLGSRGLTAQQRMFEAQSSDYLVDSNSVSEYVVEMSRASVLVVRSAPPADPAALSFLVAFSSSAHSLAAFRIMLDLSRAGDSCVLGSIVEPVLSRDDMLTIDSDALRDELRTAAASLDAERKRELLALLERRSAECVAAGMSVSTVVEERQFPPAALVRLAERTHASILVLGRGRARQPGQQQQQTGPVASYVHRNALAQTVLVCKAV